MGRFGLAECVPELQPQGLARPALSLGRGAFRAENSERLCRQPVVMQPRAKAELKLPGVVDEQRLWDRA